VVLALVLVGGLVSGGVWLYGVGGSSTSTDSGDSDGGGLAGGGSEIDGVQTYEVPVYTHVEVGETVDYDQFPPVGGEHYGMWQNCGVYDEPVVTETAVHSLEHGAVWITYDPSLAEQDVQALAAHHSPGAYVLISPMEGLPFPVVASGWGTQLLLDFADDPRLAEFLSVYEQSPNVPEPGAPCSGSYGGTQAEFEAELAESTHARRN
jgi:hypothetical protein